MSKSIGNPMPLTVFQTLVESKGLTPDSPEYKTLQEAFESTGLLNEPAAKIQSARRRKKPVAVLKEFLAEHKEEADPEQDNYMLERQLTIAILDLMFNSTTKTEEKDPLDLEESAVEDKTNNSLFTLHEGNLAFQLKELLLGLYSVEALDIKSLEECYKELNKSRRPKRKKDTQNKGEVKDKKVRGRDKKKKTSNPLTEE